VSVTAIPEQVKLRLWAKAAGRCQYEGCNKPLWLDSLTKAEFNVAYLAHIIADKPDGPRGHNVLSEKLKSDISNIMLMCDEHHRHIDKVDVAGHPVNRLQKMKEKHEKRIELLTSIQEDMKSHIILYGANIGEHHAQVSWEKAVNAMIPCFYPAENRAIELSLKNSSFQDSIDAYWLVERQHLKNQFFQYIKPRLASGDVQHFSVFGLAPIPLLIELGFLLSDIPKADVYQLHREPPDWKWQSRPDNFQFSITEPYSRHATVAINMSLSATIDDSRISHALKQSHSIWTITIDIPNNDFLKSHDQLRKFRNCFRILLDRIKAEHGEEARIHLFPAIPVSIAVEIGRVWMPKADLPMTIYDQNRNLGGFIPTFDIAG
jgi:hypothetical protein